MENLLPFEKIERELLVKVDAKTDPNYGQDPNKRPIKELISYGIINLNKPEGPTSHMVSAYVQNILEINKSGHSGTLDPLVVGVLPIALEKATRIVQPLLKTGKEYVCLMQIHKDVKEEDIKKTMEKFLGKIKQLPPVKSAIKRQERTREVYYFDILEINKQNVLFKVGTEAGTYIRKLVHDFGQELKVGAHMKQLVRTKVGSFNDETWITLQDLKDAYELYKNENNEEELKKCILPIESAVQHLPKIYVLDSTVDSICNGANLNIPGISKLDSNIKENDQVAILTLKKELVCLGVAKTTSENILKNYQGLSVDVKKVFMSSGIYPRYNK
ncbi:RNA-guided pseudouridylation complex pseudouridine synthase subunit Cbf5 [archaeon]|nr:RNA-guided pseudouridylation complex pseudouridine synthase subunit Cbf5 [archaeon]|tara:strand:- start:7413 stop:8402 length:990 start_codon:yes stop_codon:yes gene_type:complete